MLRFAVLFLVLGLTACASPSGPAPEGEVLGDGVDKEKVRAVIRDHIVPIRHCYEKELKSSPKLAGKLVLDWEIGELGKVNQVTIKNPVQKNLDSCVADVIKKSLFDAPPKGQVVRVVYPFHFSPDPEKAVK